MKAKVISDLHIDHYHISDATKNLRKIGEGEFDIVIDAGDVGHNAEGWGIAADILGKHKNYIYVPGNHDRYKDNYWTPLECNFVKNINGVKFVCSTLYSKLDKKNIVFIKNSINDFMFTSIDVFNDLHKEALNFIKKEVTKDCVVVTHFCPSFLSVHPRYANSPMNSFFANNLDDFILEREPQYWIHGHTHDPFNYKIGNTQIICNPFGYPRENNKFDYNLVIDIKEKH